MVIIFHRPKRTLHTGGSLMSPSMTAFAEYLSTVATLFYMSFSSSGRRCIHRGIAACGRNCSALRAVYASYKPRVTAFVVAGLCSRHSAAYIDGCGRELSSGTKIGMITRRCRDICGPEMFAHAHNYHQSPVSTDLHQSALHRRNAKPSSYNLFTVTSHFCEALLKICFQDIPQPHMNKASDITSEGQRSAFPIQAKPRGLASCLAKIKITSELAHRFRNTSNVVMTTANNIHVAYKLPLKVCFAMTIDTSQGQTLKFAGVDLRQDCFSHEFTQGVSDKVWSNEKRISKCYVPHWERKLERRKEGKQKGLRHVDGTHRVLNPGISASAAWTVDLSVWLATTDSVFSGPRLSVHTSHPTTCWLGYCPPNRFQFYGMVAPGFSLVGIVPDDASCRRVSSGISRFPRPCIPALLHFHNLLSSQDFDVKSRPNLSSKPLRYNVQVVLSYHSAPRLRAQQRKQPRKFPLGKTPQLRDSRPNAKVPQKSSKGKVEGQDQGHPHLTWLTRWTLVDLARAFHVGSKVDSIVIEPRTS
ncbi:hypothetical protein PR048_028002 [Dryococelus australis]|uniref:Uncharacterized protein n=1 Tax=Dryococelus australis TaxID=614101 RepID=A0ABQ9GI26_9NEOP|nr:hypothetical protein PR048_028002 [Dryococelus australis]